MNCITINTDASFHPIKKTSGYAFYIVCDLFKIQKGGNFKNPVQNPMEAELKCIGNALSKLYAQNDVKAKLIIVNTDCQFAINSILHSDKKKLFRRIRHIIRMLEHKTGAIVEFRHVKSHSGINDSRSLANEWCDKMAKQYMLKNK